MYRKYIVRTIFTWAGDLSLSQGFFALQASLFMGQLLCNSSAYQIQSTRE